MKDLNELIYNWSFALYDLCTQTKQVDIIANEAAEIVKLFKKNKDYLNYLNSYDLDDNTKFKSIDELLVGHHEYLINIVKLASKNHTVKYINIILVKFIELANAKLNIKYGTIFSVKKLTEKQIEKFEAKLSLDLNAKVHLVNEINPDLIAGIKIKVEDYLIDNSIEGQLKSLQAYINQK